MSKSVRAALLDRRFSVDKEEKAILQRCLDTLQERIPVRYGRPWGRETKSTTFIDGKLVVFRSASGMAERLETIGRKIGLKFMAAPVHGCYYLSTGE